MPLIPSSNSYNRNFVITMGHSGVKFIIDSIGKNIQEKYNVSKEREGILHRHAEPTVLNPEIRAIANLEGIKGMNAAMKLFDVNHKEDKDKKNKPLVTITSEQQDKDRAKCLADSVTTD